MERSQLVLLWGLGACYSPSLDRGLPERSRGDNYGDLSGEDSSAGGGRAALEQAPGAEAGAGREVAQKPGAHVGDPDDESADVRHTPADTATPTDVPVVESEVLPSLCVGLSYSARLVATGGAGPPYRWSLRENFPGLSLDARTGKLEGVPEAAGTLHVQVLDAEEVLGERSFELVHKRACYFAYLATEERQTRLHLGDVFGQFDLALPAEGSAPENALDFEFAPDGSWLAMRASEVDGDHLFLYPTAFVGLPPSDAELVRVPLECPVEGEACSVIDYAWSEDSRRLAVVLEGSGPERNYLSGLDVRTPEAPWPVIDSALWDEVESLPLDYRSQLLWVGSKWVAFAGAAADDPELETLYTAVLAESGDALEGLIGSSYEMGPGPHLSVAGSGVALSYAYPGEDIRDIIYSERGLAGSGLDNKQAYIGWLAPSGRALASIDGERRLQIYELGSDEIAAESERDGCNEVITWSRGTADGERIVCSHGPHDDQHARVFDYSASQRRLSPALETSAEFSVSRAHARRALSADGRWLVMTSDAGSAALVELSQFEARVDEFEPLLSPGAELAFAPTRSAVAFLSADTLVELPLPLELGSKKSFAIAGGAAPASCQVSYWEVPEHWCGAPQIGDHLLYGADSEVALFEGPPGTLNLADLASSPEPPAVRLTAALSPCIGICSRRFAFKP